MLAPLNVVLAQIRSPCASFCGPCIYPSGPCTHFHLPDLWPLHMALVPFLVALALALPPRKMSLCGRLSGTCSLLIFRPTYGHAIHFLLPWVIFSIVAVSSQYISKQSIHYNRIFVSLNTSHSQWRVGVYCKKIFVLNRFHKPITVHLD